MAFRGVIASGLLVLAVGCDGGEAEAEPEGTGSTSGGSGEAESSSGTGAGAGTGTTGESTAGSSGGGEGSSGGSESSGDESGSSGEAPTGMPVVVSLAHGGQTARSCDGGATWDSFNAFGIQDDHSDYAAFGGLTYGNGAWIAATGWGADAHVLRSTDGVNWDDLGDEAFITNEGAQRPGNGASGVEFVGDGFVLFAGAHMWRSEDGTVWSADTPETLGFHGHFREVEYLPDPGLLLLATEDYESPGSWTVQVSDDGGYTWQVGTGATTACVGYVQHDGGFAAHDGRVLLAGGTGPTCISEDGGLTWAEAGSVGTDIADVASYADGFAVLAQSGDVFVSPDAQQWTQLGSSRLDGGRFDWHPELGFFGEGNAVYASSPDGITWTDASTTPPEGYVEVREFAVGRLDDCD